MIISPKILLYNIFSEKKTPVEIFNTMPSTSFESQNIPMCDLGKFLIFVYFFLIWVPSSLMISQ